VTRSHPPGVTTCFTALPGGSATSIPDGWDNEVIAVGDQIVRIPRRREVEAVARAEARLLPLLAARLPVEVPVPLEVCAAHGAMRYRRIAGTPLQPEHLTADPSATAERFATFLAALRSVPEAAIRDRGIEDRSGAAWKAHYLDVAGRFHEMVLPRLPVSHRLAGERLLTQVAELPADVPPCLVHGDLGPSHLLCDPDGLRGVIDWSDACLGDPAIDLAWLLNGTPAPFSTMLRRTVGVEEAEAERACFYHRLGPWYEVEHGLRSGAPQLLASGIAGVVDRLPA
jgi:aminoglycoside phosphotransferase (APT) family kinase protein